ncbi:hypothetical protein AMTRI_Chr06g195070 [Amborella trichopoda]|uniref:RRM domain-containing protein n=1 Tax=Amborella trichopoda TaxID=13333 RepID=W1PPS6_AMBTC|nr:glycine-rich RNA-binding protein 2, mitochondrial [Amborella trichopoda]XP_011624954.1 glycine-rich RNA-binding protein 2, mitochondrial [Amborella trichopoda]ERN10073.1 hypothetical protein AMTR_s00013p00256900 [Amborella trichopoda]|eukprot:XP_006848492.1 glycine-rich RNA-binding protein 2, mitochondrial [Amborella trichopoda]
MAFYNRIGNLVRQNLTNSALSNGRVESISMLNAVRFMSTKLFVGGLSFGTDDQSLRDAFASFGDVVEARVITDRDTGRSRGFGFVNFDNDEAASTALSSMDGQELQGRSIRVSYANDRPSVGFRGGFGGGGYRGNDGGDGY